MAMALPLMRLYLMTGRSLIPYNGVVFCNQSARRKTIDGRPHREGRTVSKNPTEEKPGTEKLGSLSPLLTLTRLTVPMRFPANAESRESAFHFDFRREKSSKTRQTFSVIDFADRSIALSSRCRVNVFKFLG